MKFHLFESTWVVFHVVLNRFWEAGPLLPTLLGPALPFTGGPVTQAPIWGNAACDEASDGPGPQPPAAPCGYRQGGRLGGKEETDGYCLLWKLPFTGRLQSYGSPHDGQSCPQETCWRDLGSFPASHANHRHGEPLWFLKLIALPTFLRCAAPSPWNVLTSPEEFQLITQESSRGTNCFSLLPIMIASSLLFHPYTSNNISLLILSDRLIDWLVLININSFHLLQSMVTHFPAVSSTQGQDLCVTRFHIPIPRPQLSRSSH